MIWTRSVALALIALLLCGCATGQDIYVGADIVQVIPHAKAVSFLQKIVRRSHTGYECAVSDQGIAFPSRQGMFNMGVVPFDQLRAHTVWASWPSGGTGFVLSVEGAGGLVVPARCILFVHPDPGEFTLPPPNKDLSTALEAIVSLGAAYSKPSRANVPGLRVFMPIGL